MEIRRDRGSSAATRKIHPHQLETMIVGSLLPFHLDPFTSLELFVTNIHGSSIAAFGSSVTVDTCFPNI
jgi:hypothetical protein